MAARKRKRGIAATAPFPCRFARWLRLVRPRREYPPPPPPPPRPPPQPPSSPSASGSSSSTSSEAIGTRPSYPRPLIRGTRSIKEPKPWTCVACGSENELTHHLLFDLPPFKCETCDADPPEGAADFGFCYGDLGVNGFCPIGNVKDQIGLEITQRIMRIILEEPLSEEGPLVSVDDLLKKYEIWCEERCEGNDKFDIRSLIIMLRVLDVDGVKDMESGGVYKIYDWDYIDEDDFAALSSALADGYPLVTGFRTGKRVQFLEPGELYMPPGEDSISKDGKRKPVGHMVLLVGAQQERTEKFFYFLSSWGEDFCSRMDEGDGILGGIGAIRAEGIAFSPLQILRFNERRKQEVQHPKYPSL